MKIRPALYEWIPARVRWWAGLVLDLFGIYLIWLDSGSVLSFVALLAAVTAVLLIQLHIAVRRERRGARWLAEVDARERPTAVSTRGLPGQ